MPALIKTKPLTLDNFTVCVTGTYLSDLFFNFSHDNWSALFGPKLPVPSDDAMWDATVKDASEFLMSCGVQESELRYNSFRKALVEDFLARV